MSKPLIPIRIDLEVHGVIAHTPEHLWPVQGDPRQAAESLLKELGLTPSHGAYYQRAQQNAQNDLERASGLFADAAQHSPQPQMVKILLAARLGSNRVFIDHVSWDLKTPIAMVEVYASRVARDFSLGRHMAMFIVEKMRKEVSRMRSLAEAGEIQPQTLPDAGCIVRGEPGRRPPFVLTYDEAVEFLSAERHVAAERAGGGRATPDGAKADSGRATPELLPPGRGLEALDDGLRGMPPPEIPGSGSDLHPSSQVAL